jgi:hypothetical protein
MKLSYKQALQIVADFTEGLTSNNNEYERGQLELLADAFPVKNMETDVRMGEIATDVRKLHAKNLRKWAVER